MGIKDGARGWLTAAGLVLCLLLALPAAGRTVLDLNEDRQPVPLLDWGDAWTDPTGEVGIDRVARDGTLPWQPTRGDGIYPLRHGQALWIRFTVPPAPDSQRWYLDIPYASVNRVTLYTQDVSGKWTPQSAGDWLPVADWPVPNRHPLLPIQLSAEEPRHHLLKVENSLSFGAPLSFVSEGHLARREQWTSLVLGMYFGLAALAAVLAALSAVSLRDTAYAWYAATVVLMAASQAALTGVAGLHLWPHEPGWNDLSPFVLSILAVVALQGFIASVISLPERSRPFHYLLLGAGLAGLATAVGALLVEPSSRLMLLIPYISCALTLALAALAWSARRGDRYALWLLLANLPVMTTAAFPLLRTAGVIPVSFLTTHGMQLAIALELPLLLVILMMRSQHRRETRRRIHGLGRIDPATGLINSPVFEERLEQMIARSQRFKYRSAVLMVEIVNLEQIRRDFDRRSADELPLRVAGRLLAAAREIDSVARLAGHRFGMLLEGPLTATEVAEAGPRVVARCLMPFRNKPVEWVAQVRVAQALVPMDGTDTEAILARLEQVLANVPGDTRRAVFNVPRPLSEAVTS